MLPTVFETVMNRHLRVSVLGKGSPLLLLHGYPENLQIWERLAPRLATKFQVFAFDWPGMGYSDEWPGGASPEFIADKLLRLLEHWNIDRVSIVAMDMGGQPALVFAAKYPDRIERLTVMNCLAFGDLETSLEIRLLRKFGWNRFILKHLPETVFQRALSTFLPGEKKLPSSLRDDFWESFRREEVRRFISKMCAGYQGTLKRLPHFYRLIRCPTLILWGQNDRHFPPVHAERLHKIIPESKLHVIPEAEHWMAWHCADQIANEILEFSLPGTSLLLNPESS